MALLSEMKMGGVDIVTMQKYKREANKMSNEMGDKEGDESIFEAHPDELYPGGVAVECRGCGEVADSNFLKEYPNRIGLYCAACIRRYEFQGREAERVADRYTIWLFFSHVDNISMNLFQYENADLFGKLADSIEIFLKRHKKP